MIKFKCLECGERMEVSRKMAGMRVRCVECKAPADVPKPAKRRKRTEEEEARLRELMQHVDREQMEQEERDAKNDQISLQFSWIRSDAGLFAGIFMVLGGVIWFAFAFAAGYFSGLAVILIVFGFISAVQGIIWHVRAAARRKRRRKRSSR